MGGNRCILVFILVLFSRLICLWNLPLTLAVESQATYIIHVKQPAVGTISENMDIDSYYHSFLPSNVAGIDGPQRIVYSYRNVVSGFAAKLTAEEAEAIRGKEGVLSIQQEKVLYLHTTHSPRFLGLLENVGVWKDSNFGKGVIIGVLDTGITPGHPSFGDYGVPLPPAKWKGKCNFNETVCNNKLIGARSFTDSGPPFDEAGHGTHTSSTAGGNFVKGASALGNANGTAAGMAPMAHIAMYKVCDKNGACFESAMLAALDAAIEDGVDILSISIGGNSSPFFSDNIAVGAFGAMKKGILVSCSAGNGGPYSSSLSNESPWILTVGASTIDRKIVATAQLGNGQAYDGESLFQPRDFPSTQLPLVYPGANGNASIAQCLPGSLSNANVNGKVVLCLMGIGRILKGQEVKDAGGAAMILINNEIFGDTTFADAHVLPATQVNYIAGQAILSYVNSTSRPTATIKFKGTVIGDSTAPAVSFFSSRGPSIASPGILKPDIIGPGVNILAAWPIPLDNNTEIFPTFNVISGTSMSCPHLSGIAALIKSSHPDWSPAAIKSAIMTTAYTLNLENKLIFDETLTPANVFATGSGHANPSKANDPGLIYDIKPDNYIPYLCGLGYTDTQVQLIVQKPVDCSQVGNITEGELNYPSFTVKLLTDSIKISYSRIVTNVGPSKAYFKSEIIPPEGVDIGVYPGDLKFSGKGESLSYRVDFSKSVGHNMTKAYSEGALIWVSEEHTVRSPIVVFFM